MRRASWPLMMLAVAATGCTMCPDPFDYSGPVPNGSVTQNDFCARSNGILPLDASPRPWPPLVNGDDEQTRARLVVAEDVEAGDGAVVAEFAEETAAATAEYPQE